jgi:hypothetical protein
MNTKNTLWRKKKTGKSINTALAQNPAWVSMPFIPKVEQVEPKTVKETKQKAQTLKAQNRSKQQFQPQTTGIQLSDFTMELDTNLTHINILTKYQGHYIHSFSLNNTEYVAWLHSTLQHKYIYVHSKVNPEIFFKNLQIVQMVITNIIQTVDTLLTRLLQAQRAQQAQQAHIRRRLE